MANSPPFPSTTRTGIKPVAVSTLNTAIDGTGSFDTVMTPQASGGRFDGMIIEATTTTAADVLLNVFYFDGANEFLLDQIYVQGGITPTATTPAWRTVWHPPLGPIMMASGDLIKMAVSQGTITYHVTPIGVNW